MSQNNRSPVNNGGDVMEVVGKLDERVGKIENVVEEHVRQDHKELTNAISKLTVTTEQLAKSSEKTDETIEAIKELTLAIRDEGKDGRFELEKQIMETRYESRMENKNQDLKAKDQKIEDSKDSFWMRLKYKVEDKIIEIMFFLILLGYMTYNGLN